MRIDHIDNIDNMFQPLSFGFMDHLTQQSAHHHHHTDHDFLMEDDDEDSRDEMGQVDTTNASNNNSQRKAEIRKSNKPIMEKKRRARINNCLNDLKAILLEAMRKDPARHSKLEKADILELTVRHLQNVQRNQLAIAMASDPTVLHRFKNGFSECLTEVNRYMGKLDGIDQGMRHRLTGHLSTCINGLQQVTPPAAAAAPPPMSMLPAPHSHFTPNIANIMIVPTNLSTDRQTSSAQGIIKQETRSVVQQQQQQQQPPPSLHSLSSQDLNNNTNTNTRTMNERQHFPSSAFSFITADNNNYRTPPPQLPAQLQSSSSSILISPPTSSESDDTSLLSTSTSINLNNTSISSIGSSSSSGGIGTGSGSDISICTGSEKGTNTSPNSFAKSCGIRPATNVDCSSSPIDFSLKYKEAPVVRVLKVEPIMMNLLEIEPPTPERCERGGRRMTTTTTILGPKDSMWRPW